MFGEGRMNKQITTITIVLLMTYIIPAYSLPVHGDATELSVVDSSDIADLIIKGDVIHFVAQVQTDDEILYSTIRRNGTYVTLRDDSESTSYTYQYNGTGSENPYNNFYRLHFYFTDVLSEGKWNAIHHVELENGQSRNSAPVQFSIVNTYHEPIIIDYTEEEFTTKDIVFISARITNQNPVMIPKVEVIINETVFSMVREGDIFSANVGMMPSTVDSFTYKVHTGRKIDGDSDHTHGKPFHINIREIDSPADDLPPVTNDTTTLPDRIYRDSELLFEVMYSDNEGDTPEKVEMSIYNSTTGALPFQGTLKTEGGNYTEGVAYSLAVDLSQLNITPGLWSYKIKYRCNGSDFIIAMNNFNVVTEVFDHKPELTDLTSRIKVKKTDSVEFILEWKDEDGDEPSEVWVEIYDEGESLVKVILSGSSGGARYSVGINLSNLEITGNEKITYRYNYVYGEENSFPLPPVQPFEIHFIEENPPNQPDQPIVIVLIILVTIVILLALFVFTFGKRDPY